MKKEKFFFVYLVGTPAPFKPLFKTKTKAAALAKIKTGLKRHPNLAYVLVSPVGTKESYGSAVDLRTLHMFPGDI